MPDRRADRRCRSRSGLGTRTRRRTARSRWIRLFILTLSADAAADAQRCCRPVSLPQCASRRSDGLLEQPLGLERDVLVDRLDLARPLARRQPEQLDQVSVKRSEYVCAPWWMNVGSTT